MAYLQSDYLPTLHMTPPVVEVQCLRTLYLHVPSVPEYLLGLVCATKKTNVHERSTCCVPPDLVQLHGVLCCFALFVCLTLLASFFLPSHLSFKNMCFKQLYRCLEYCTVQMR